METKLDADSTDLSDVEVKAAIMVDRVEGMIEQLRAQVCPECGIASFPVLHEQRRRNGVLYCRMRLRCDSSKRHERVVVFRVAALQIEGLS